MSYTSFRGTIKWACGEGYRAHGRLTDMAGMAAKKTKGFVWNDYRQWPNDERWELIGGEAFAMTPASNTRHQRVVAKLHVELARFFQRKKCELFLSPVDVKLSEQDVVEPDLVVVCNPNQVKTSHIEGAPTLVVEVLSTSTALYDRQRKMDLYARSGVKEVWLVTPCPASVETYLLIESGYRLAAVYGKVDTLKSATFPRLRVALGKVFDFPLEPGESVSMVGEGHPSYHTRRRKG